MINRSLLAISFFILTQTIFAVPLPPTTYYVSGMGDDNNNGLSTTTAFRTLQMAANLVNPGDVVFAMNGIYSNQLPGYDVLWIARSGTASAYIEFKNYPGHSPKIKFTGWQGIKFNDGAAYIKVSGFEVEGNNANVTLANALNQPGSCANPTGASVPIYNGNGIASDGRDAVLKPHHLVVSNNVVHDCGGGGISMIQSDYITVENNVIYNNSWYTIYGASGISFWQLWNFDNNTSGYRNIIRNNRCFGNRLYVPWIGQCAITDGNGIIIDDTRNTQNGSTLGAYNGRTYVVNNIVWNNGGSGIHTYESEHVDIVNNTAYKNAQSTELSGEIFANASNDIRIYNNILVNPAGKGLNSNYSNTNVFYNYNLHFGGGTAALTGANTATGNPNFVNANATLNADFHLMVGSAALNIGTNSLAPTVDCEQNPRPSNNIDIGAYEFSAAMPVELLRFEGQNTEGGKNVLTWQTATELNTSNFDLEQSDDIVIFNKIGEVKAKGSNSTYQFEDNPKKNLQYYRLKINDLDGKTGYSKIISLKAKGTSKVKVYPSVTSGILTIEGAASFDVVNSVGQIVMSEKDIQHSSFIVHHLASGVYVVRGVDTEGAAFVERFFRE